MKLTFINLRQMPLFMIKRLRRKGFFTRKINEEAGGRRYEIKEWRMILIKSIRNNWTDVLV